MNKKNIYEVEKKYKIDQNRREKLINFLNEKAKLIEKKHEVDTYFNVVGRDSLSTKECLRVRETDSFSEITYKPSSEEREKYQGHFSKVETNLRIENGEDFIHLFHLLGNKILSVVDKQREYYLFHDCTVTVDRVEEEGDFVEVEIQTENEEEAVKKIDEVARLLELDEDAIEKRPYRDLVLEII